MLRFKQYLMESIVQPAPNSEFATAYSNSHLRNYIPADANSSAIHDMMMSATQPGGHSSHLHAVSQHPNTSPETLETLRRHAANMGESGQKIIKNVVEHPSVSPETLHGLSNTDTGSVKIKDYPNRAEIDASILSNKNTAPETLVSIAKRNPAYSARALEHGNINPDAIRTIGYSLENYTSLIGNPKTPGDILEKIKADLEGGNIKVDDYRKQFYKDTINNNPSWQAHDAQAKANKANSELWDSSKPGYLKTKDARAADMEAGTSAERAANAAKVEHRASGPSAVAANPSLASGTKVQQVVGQTKAIGGPLVAQLAGELVAPYVEKMGEKTGIIDTLAKGISAVIPNSILAAGNSPADNERADQEISNNLKKMGIKSGRVSGPMGIDIGKK